MKKIYKDYKYHVITYHPTVNGFDEKPEVKDMKQAKEAAKWYLNNGYESVYILTDTEVVKVFDKYNRNGRKAYDFEIDKFTFAKRQQTTAIQLSFNF